MKKPLKLLFVARVFICMLFSFILNLFLGWHLKSDLSQKEYEFVIDIEYNNSGVLEVLYDTGSDFNSKQLQRVKVNKGRNSIKIPFQLNEGEQLKFLRLDFGQENTVSRVKIFQALLLCNTKELFDFGETEVKNKISFLHGILGKPNKDAVFNLNVNETPYDPYVVFHPLNELIYPKWQRTLLLVLPWVLMFFFPLFIWFTARIKNKEYALIFVALFFASIPLKIAWVTFTSLLLSAFAVVRFIQKRNFKISKGRYAVIGLFLIPLLFLNTLEPSRLGITIGFVIFSLIFSILDLSKYHDDIKLIYTKVFFVVMSISIVSWLLFIGYAGYFYGVQLENYFNDIKISAHMVMDWLYYSHTTFLSFFILLGGIFCLDLLKRNIVSKIYAITFFALTIVSLLILGSRFAWFLALMLPLLYAIPLRPLKMLLLPLWAVVFAVTVSFIGKLDALRDELWQISFSQIKDNLWFGQGTGNSELIIPKQFVIIKNGEDTWININHSHNQFLTYLLENGVLGFLLFTALILYIWQLFSKENNKVMLLIMFSILLLMIIESPFKTTTPLYLFSFLWCCFFQTDKRNRVVFNK